MRILVIAAHPDDEVLGVGGTMARYAENGDEVYTLILTDGSSTQYKNDKEKLNVKKEQAKKANQILGVEEVIFKNLPDMKLDTVSHIEINKNIEEEVRRIKPDIIFTHHKSDVNKDHNLIYESTLVATRPVDDYSVKELYTYETLSSTEWTSNDSEDIFKPNTYININEQFSKKVKSLKAYKTEIRDYPHPRSIKGMDIFNSMRGLAVGLRKAEAFNLIRRIK